MRQNLSTPNHAETRNCAFICRKKGEEMCFGSNFLFAKFEGEEHYI